MSIESACIFGVRSPVAGLVARFLTATDALCFVQHVNSTFRMGYECYVISTGTTFTTISGAYADEIAGRFERAAEIAEAAKPGGG